MVRELGEIYIKCLVLKQQIIAANFALGSLRILTYNIATAPVLTFEWVGNVLIPLRLLMLHLLFLILHVVHKYYFCLPPIGVCCWLTWLLFADSSGQFIENMIWIKWCGSRLGSFRVKS